jgi:hypothetical protein
MTIAWGQFWNIPGIIEQANVEQRGVTSTLSYAGSRAQGSKYLISAHFYAVTKCALFLH